MAATPKRKHSTRRQGIRRAAIHQGVSQSVICPVCKKRKLAHFACSNCENR